MFPLFLPIFLSIFPSILLIFVVIAPSFTISFVFVLHSFLYVCLPYLFLPSLLPSFINFLVPSFFLLSFLYVFSLFHPFISSFLSLSLHMYHSSGMVIFTLFDARLTHYSELLEERHRFAAKQMTVPRAHRICCSLSLACGGVIGVGTTRTQ